MPRHPQVSPSVADISGAVYSKLAHRLGQMSGEVYALHVGDTWMEPPVGARMEDLRVADHPGMHRYAPPQGLPVLLDAIVARQKARTGVPTTRENILVSTGATGGLSAIAGAIVAPGDEVLILAPFWPLVSGIMRSFHGIPVPVSFLGAESAEEVVDRLRAKLTPRTIAVYWNTPNNPSGLVLPKTWIETFVEWARSEGLWILADEVYEDYVFGDAHAYTRTLAPERTFAAHSFSKAYGMAGNRCGYVVGPDSVMPDLRKVSTHGFYSTPTAAQLAALVALGPAGDAWVAAAKAQYAETGAKAAARLGVAPPQGSTFLFLDVAADLPRFGDQGLEGLLEACVDRGLFVSPGPSFGPFPHHVRLCFTASPPDVVARGVEILAQVLGR